MNHSLLAIAVNYDSLVCFSQSKHTDSIFIESDEIVVLFDENTLCLRFPQLERLVPIHHRLVTLVVDI